MAVDRRPDRPPVAGSAAAGRTEAPALPPIDELDRLDAPGFERALGPLFEGSPRFVRRLAAGRPYGSYDALLDRALEVALTMPENEQIELLESHPRIGAPPATVSRLSFEEQAYDRPTRSGSPDRPDDALETTLERLNAAYEERFGFRFVIFVAGRERSAIVPIMEERLRADRDAEKRRALSDVIAIARDRAVRLAAPQRSALPQERPPGTKEPA